MVNAELVSEPQPEMGFASSGAVQFFTAKRVEVARKQMPPTRKILAIDNG